MSSLPVVSADNNKKKSSQALKKATPSSATSKPAAVKNTTSANTTPSESSSEELGVRVDTPTLSSDNANTAESPPIPTISSDSTSATPSLSYSTIARPPMAGETINQSTSVHATTPNQQSNDFFSFLSQQLNVTQIAASIESKANELVEMGRRSGIVEKASEFVEVTKENAIELAKQAQELKESYEKYHGDQRSAPTVPQNGAEPDLDLTYITENLIAMAFPYDTKKVRTHDGNDIRQVHRFLEQNHREHYMIWNISEESYDYSLFNDQVLDYQFPGHPAPPLGLLFKICTSIESWLDADADNVAVVHCYTGKGRTAALMACVLCWIGEFPSPIDALQYVAERKGAPLDKLTIPSQRRYVQYFSNMIDGVKPRPEPLLLRRVIMNTVPSFGDNPLAPGSLGCKPYVQLFKNGKLINTTASQFSITGNETILQWIDVNEGSASFNVDCPVQGDILIRCRHVDEQKRVSMFRAAFHTGYVPVGVLRLTRLQLDGPALDSRFHDDFFIDLIFAPMVESNLANEASSKPTDNGLLLDKNSAEACEEVMHKDARFWESISARKAKARRRRARRFLSSTQERFSIADDSPRDQPMQAKTHTSDATTGNAFSNNDLILELSRAQEDSVFNIPAKSTEGGTYPAEGKDSSDLRAADKSVFVTPSAPISASKEVPPSELSALEELEKELGLEGFVIPTPDTAAATRRLSELSSIVDEDIDELERFMNSLTSTPPPNK